MRKLVIGVDGGNTKTDYFLFDRQGHFIGHLRDGTCSRESVGYESAEAILHARVKQLTAQFGYTTDDVEAAVFGLAGIDNPVQQQRFTEIIGRLGIPHFVVDNDSYLGIFAGTSAGCGVCSINGTGTVTGGMDRRGRRLQVGGIGPLVGDDAGGLYIAHRGVRAVYDSFYRCGEPTMMSEPVFALLGIQDPGELMHVIGQVPRELSCTEMTRIVFTAAGLDDRPALEIMHEIGRQLAKTTAGCVRNLDFDKEVEVVLAGAVWVRAESPVLFNAYERHMRALLPDKSPRYYLLREPPATGAVLWALSLCGTDCFSGDIRRRVAEAVERVFA